MVPLWTMVMSSTFPPMYALLSFHKNWLEPGQSHHHHHLSWELLQVPHNCSPCFHSCPLNSVLIRTTRGSLFGICHITSPSAQTFPMAPHSLSKNQRPSDVLPDSSVSDPQYLSTVSSSISIFISFPPILDARLVFCFFSARCFLAPDILMVHFLPTFRSHPKCKLIWEEYFFPPV